MPHLQTQRLTIVPFTAELAEAAIAGPNALERYLGVSVAEGWPIPDLAEVLPVFVRMLRADPLLAEWMGSIVHRGDQTLIGDMGFKSRPDENGVAEIGYGIVPAYWRQGYGFEAVNALVEWGWTQPMLKKITAECDQNNLGSIRILEKLGMQQVGTAGEMVKWELVKAD